MTQRFVVTNQDGHYYSKQKLWTDGRDPARVYCTAHRDEALNTLLEINAKDIELRGQVVAVELNARNLPILEISDVPLPEPEPAPEPVEDAAATLELEAPVNEEIPSGSSASHDEDKLSSTA